MRQAYRVEALALHQVGVFDDLRLDFKPITSLEQDAEKAEIHIFTGPNGCGKSTLLYAIAEIFDALTCDNKGFLIADNRSLIWQRLRGEQSSIDFIRHYQKPVSDTSSQYYFITIIKH